MILVNTDYISGKELEMLGLVKGSTIQSKHVGKDITQSFKTLVGGELTAYNEMMNEARAIATKRMVAEAEALGAGQLIVDGLQIGFRITIWRVHQLILPSAHIRSFNLIDRLLPEEGQNVVFANMLLGQNG